MTFLEKILNYGSRLQTRAFSLVVAPHFMKIGRGTRIQPPFRCSGFEQISLGDNVVIHRDCWLQALGVRGDSPKLIIKSHAGIGMGATIAAAQQVVIGEYVLMARNVYIADHGHAFADVNTPIMHQGIDNIRPVAIGRHTWLGQNVCILPGASIGIHCVIGANSVVKSSIPDFSVAVGTPARVVKRFNADTLKWEKANMTPG